MKINSNSSNKLNTTCKKGKMVLTLFVVVVALTFVVTGLAALMTFHSGPFAVVAVAQQVQEMIQ